MKVWLRGSSGRANAEPSRVPQGPSQPPTAPHGLYNPTRTPERPAGKAGTCQGAGAGPHHHSMELLAHSHAASPAAPHGLPCQRQCGFGMRPGYCRGPGHDPGPSRDPGAGSGSSSDPGYGSQHLLHPSTPSPVQSCCFPLPDRSAPVRHRQSPGDPSASPSSGPHTVCSRLPGPHREQHEPLPVPGRLRAEAPDQPPPRRPPTPCPRLRAGESAAGAGDPRLGRVRSHLYLPGAIRGGAGVTAGPERPRGGAASLSP